MGLSSLWPLSSIEMYFSLVPSMDAALTADLRRALAATSSEASSGPPDLVRAHQRPVRLPAT